MSEEVVGTRRRCGKRYEISSLPYKAMVYLNNQVLIPAILARTLGITNARYANVIIEHNGVYIELKCIRLLRTRHTDSRQFTIPKRIREVYGIKPGDIITVISIRPCKSSECLAEKVEY